ncbi:MAG: M23 family metallopeptidase [Thermoanaerobaculia bacterium]|nr:M23 family metallopeptidase [Thermoanaerobaculia bacterium]
MADGSTAHPIELRHVTPNEPYVAGEILELHGKERFNSGQLQSLTFRLGESTLEPNAIGTDDVTLRIPESTLSGEYALSVVRHGEQRGSDTTLFEERIRVTANAVVPIASANGDIQASGGTLTAGGLSIRLGPDPSGGSMAVRLTQTASPLERKWLLNHLTATKAGSAVSVTLSRVEFDRKPSSSFSVNIALPNDLKPLLSPTNNPTMLVELFGEDDVDYVSLSTSFNPATGILTATIPADYVDPSDPGAASAKASGLAPSQAKAYIYSVTIKVLLSKKNSELCGFTRLDVQEPATGLSRATSTGTFHVRAIMDFALPRRLTNPTAHNIYNADGSIFVAGRDYKRAQPNRHLAIDLRSYTSDPLYAAEDGMIETVADDPYRPRPTPLQCPSGKVLNYYSRGHFIELRHYDGNLTRYSHLNTPNAAEYSARTQVRAGEQFAEADNSGQSCASHLHFSYYICNFALDDGVDPKPWLRADAPDPLQYLADYSVVVTVAGVPLVSSRRSVNATIGFLYDSNVALSELHLAPGTYPATLRLEDTAGRGVTLYEFSVEVTASRPSRLRVDMDSSIENNALHGVSLQIEETYWRYYPWFANYTNTVSAPILDGKYYRVLSFYAGRIEGIPSNVRYRVYLDDQLVDDFSTTIDAADEVWIGCYPERIMPNDQTPPYSFCKRVVRRQSQCSYYSGRECKVDVIEPIP